DRAPARGARGNETDLFTDPHANVARPFPLRKSASLRVFPAPDRPESVYSRAPPPETPCGEGLQENPLMRFQSRFAPRLLTMAFLLASLVAGSRRAFAAEECAANAGPRWIVAFPAELESQLRAEGVEIWDRDEGALVGGATQAVLDSLSDLKIDPKLKVLDEGQYIYLLSHDSGFAAPPVSEAGVFPL